MWDATLDFLRGHRRFLISTHLNPEQDAIGSQVALREILRGMGKEAIAWNTSTTPLGCRFLDPADEIRQGRAPHDGELFRWADAAILLDVNTWAHLGEVGAALRGSSLPRAMIDHHRGGDADIAEVRVTDTSAAATGVLIAELARALGAPLTPSIASALFAAIAVDTGSFRHANTDARALETAADLVRRGAKPDALYREVFENTSWARLRLLPLALGSLRTDADGKIAWITITRAMYRDAGAGEEDSDRFVDEIRAVRGVEVSAVFRETESGQVKATLRSNGRVDVFRVASALGGGGHRLAAGATLAGPLDEAVPRVVAALREGLPAETG
jgi:phosphoesterase RecJ-like protein